MVDLVCCVVDGIEARGHARSLQCIEREAACVDRRIGDHTHVSATESIARKPPHDVATAELVHLDVHATFRLGDQVAHELKDRRVLPEPHRL